MRVQCTETYKLGTVINVHKDYGLFIVYDVLFDDGDNILTNEVILHHE